jgi:hypothetical protein
MNVRVLTAVTVVLLAGAVFAMNAGIAREFDRLHVFEENDVLFHTDLPCRLANLAHGWCDRGRGYVHPNLANLSSLPVRALARLAVVLGVAEVPEIALRRQLTVFYAPLVSALQFVVVFLLFRRLRFAAPAALAISILTAITFCQLIYGSIPESYALSSCAIAVAYLVAVDAVRSERKFSGVAAVAVGVVAAGITITAIAPLAVLRWITCRQRGSSVAACTRSTAVYAVVVIGCTFALASVLDRAYGAARRPVEDARSFATAYRRTDVARRAADFPVVLLSTIVSTFPRTVSAPREPRTHSLVFTLDGGERNVRLQRSLGVVLLALLLIGVARAPASAGEWKAAAYASIVIIAYNGILHSFWGDELFLYASHWLIPLVVLIGGWLPLWRRAAALNLAAFAALTLAVAALNAQTLAQMFALLRLQAASH